MRDTGTRDAILVELSFGSLPAVPEATFVVLDSRVTPTSNVLMSPSGIAATGRQADESEFEVFECRCTPIAGSFKAYVRSLMGRVTGLYKFAYVLR